MLWRLYAFLSALLVVGLVLASTRGILWVGVVIFLALIVGAVIVFAARSHPATQLAAPVSAPPPGETAVLEGRVDRMTMEEVEVPVNLGTAWEGERQLAEVYVIVISGLRYTVDPRPARRGRFDWLQEGMWVRATFDRKARVIYDLQWTPAPTA